MNSLKMFKEKIAWRKTAPSIFLVLNSFVWFTLTHAVFNIIINGFDLPDVEKLILFATYFLSIAVSAIFGSKLFPRKRIEYLNLWLFMGVIATLLLATASINGILANALLALFLGFSIGVGMPSCLSFFADLTSIENRGLVGGIIWSTVGFTVLIFAFLISMLEILEAIGLLTAWRLLGSLSFLFMTKRHKKLDMQRTPHYLELVRKRETLLYLFPWIMFSTINFAEAPLLERVFGAEFFTFVQLVGYALIGIFAIIGGLVADVVGRKRVVITGFVMLGIEYAALSIFYDSIITLYLFLILDGITWGLFFSVFFMAIWGDLGENHEKEKYYTVGGLPYLLASFLSILIKPYVNVISPTAAFSFASFFLFLAVIPLMYAPETLPEKHVRERELRSYIEKAKKIKEKFT
jgi:MFS family permease|uniref:MFS transporter n=1 Tax=Desulfurella acetivorans TaxID=33002 RepID=A0A832ERQ8_DESAE